MMRTHFLKEKIEAGFEDERKLLEHEPEKRRSYLPYLMSDPSFLRFY